MKIRFILFGLILLNHEMLFAQNSKAICTNQKNVIYKNIILKTDAVPNLLGTVTKISGEISVISKDLSTRKIKLNDPIFEGEKIISESKASMQIKMSDAGLMTISGGTEIEFIKYQDNCLSECTFVAKILVGSMRYLTGLIGKINPNNIELKTPTLALGHRGTDHKLTVVLENNLNIRPGTYDRVYSGGTTISNAYGRLNVDAGQIGFAALSGDLSPQILKKIPFFLIE